MVFQFSLATLLRLRRGEQRQRELLLLRANEHVHRIEREMEAIDAQAKKTGEPSRATGQTSGAELEFAEQLLRVLAARREDAQARLEQARMQQSLAGERFREVWQRRESLETLERRERELHRVEEARRQQRVQDDLFLQRKRD
jgi:flagellar export protein FliJ